MQRPSLLDELLELLDLPYEPLVELLELEELLTDFVIQLMQYIASSSMYFPQFRHLLECLVQQFVSPEEAI